MNKILTVIQKLITDSIREDLPQVAFSELEKNGAVFYMNGKNGTEFDWHVNNKLSDFMAFYDSGEHLGIAKATVYDSGDVLLHLYEDQGRKVAREIKTCLKATEEELLSLAVTLRHNADDRKIWDADICDIDTDTLPSEEEISEFTANVSYYKKSIELKALMAKTVIVSKKVREGGWKIGYGERSEPTGERDSGWCFCVGDESDEYINDPKNLELWLVNSLLMFDPALQKFITAPYGTGIVRTGHNEFDLDAPGKDIFIEKREV